MHDVFRRFASLLLGVSLLCLNSNLRSESEPIPPSVPQGRGFVLTADQFKHYTDSFNANDRELYAQFIPNQTAWAFLATNMPLFECPDRATEEAYYFRWWTYRKHIKQTPDGFVISEFLPSVPWAGKYNTIDCAAGHHLYEGRWLHDPKYLDDYAAFWFRKGGEPQRYSFWAVDAVFQRYLVTGDRTEIIDLLPDLIRNYENWERGWRDPNGLFWQEDGRDGMEVSLGGSGYRATINSYMYGDARAIAAICKIAGQPEAAARFENKAVEIKRLVEEKLWDSSAQFFKVLPRDQNAKLADARELHGFTPWYFNLPGPEYSIAWKQLMDPNGFFAPFGPTTAEQRNRHFAVSYEGHECQWNGPSWPYATAITLTALANLLNHSPQNYIAKSDYFKLLGIYARSQRLKREDGRDVAWIDENLNPFTGDWVARTRLKTWKNGTWDPEKGGVERGKDYNHSTFCDLILTGLAGLRPRADNVVEVNPLVPEGVWDYFCLDNVLYHGRILTLLFDRTGSRYRKGAGLRLFADGREIGHAPQIGRLTAVLPDAVEAAAAGNSKVETSAGWVKSPANPVLGGNLGTCFDISVLKEEDKYRMWFSWRPKASVALVESRDGIHWSEPLIVLGPNAATTWEEDINRPVVLKKENTYHMWYTGQAKGGSWIGYATSSDGVAWKRMSAQPVLSPGHEWESAAVMCPHVIWDAPKGLYRMWYSGGEQYEPNAIGYATSTDGVHWAKDANNPIFRPDKRNIWEQDRVTACEVIAEGGWYYMFYIGFQDINHAQIGIARSRDGISAWQRHPLNPIIRTGENKWDHDAVYKPYALLDGDRWLLWSNGRHGNKEQIGVAIHQGKNLGFE